MTYQPDFSGCWGKIGRAKEHIDALQGEIRDVFAVESNRVRVSVEFDRESGYHVFRVATLPTKDLLLRFGLIIGDATHNLRGALDHLVWQLSRFGRKGRQPRNPKSVQFPIVQTPIPGIVPGDFMAGKKQALWDVMPNHRAIIEGYQPYNPWHGSGQLVHPLTRLGKLSNDDKHRVVNTVLLLPMNLDVALEDVFGGVAWEIVEVRNLPHPLWTRLELNAQMGSVKVDPPTLQVNMEVAGYVAPDIGLPDTVHNSGVVPAKMAIDQMAERVIRIIREFEPLF